MVNAAHRLKSTAASFGGKRLADVCVAIEQWASHGQTAAALDFIAALSELVEASTKELLAVRDELFGRQRNNGASHCHPWTESRKGTERGVAVVCPGSLCITAIAGIALPPVDAAQVSPRPVAVTLTVRNRSESTHR